MNALADYEKVKLTLFHHQAVDINILVFAHWMTKATYKDNFIMSSVLIHVQLLAIVGVFC
jgi:hypothetical protein